MSNAVFPSFAGRAWPLKISPAWKTKVLQAASGREVRAAFQATATWSITMSFDYFSRADYLVMSGFFMAVRGQLDSFLVDAGADSLATDTAFATGDGATKSFQLCRQLSTFVEAVHNVASVSAIKGAGSTISASGYSVGSTGIVTFVTAPAAGVVLTWSGSFYYRCRFDQDGADFEEFMSRLYNLKSLKFKGGPTNKFL